MDSASLDRFDRAILLELEADCRQSFGALAEKVGLSKTPCWNRVQTLEREGVITGFRASIDPQAVGLSVSAIVTVSVDFSRHNDFEARASEEPLIVEISTITGQADYLLKVVAKNLESLDGFLRKELSLLPGVHRFSSMICMKSIKSGGSIMQASRATNQ